MGEKSIATWYRAVVIALVGSCALAGVGLVGTSSYELAEVFQGVKLEQKIIREIHLIEEVDCHGYTVGNHTYHLPDSCGGGESDEKTGPLESDSAHKYKLILVVCLVWAIILGVVQFFGSFFVVCGCNTERVRSNVKGWILGATFIFLLGLLCLMVSLSFNVSDNRHFNVQGMGHYLKKKFEKLGEIRGWEELGEDLFFYVLGCNQALLLVCGLVLASLLPCGTQTYQSIHGV